MTKSKHEATPTSNPQRSTRKFVKAPLDDMLVKGEEIIVEAEIHWAIYWKAVAIIVCGCLLGGVIFELGLLLIVSGIFSLIYNYIRKEILMLVVTNKRILVRYGILQVDIVDLRFSKMESIELERMIPGYILGYANVVMMGTGNRFMVVPFVTNAVEIRRAYNDLTLPEEGPEDKVVKEAVSRTN
ncbi:MAG: PH domain-containing protein [Micavibrio sp.]|nr:PH domain-containing protein [Micavibrio sp.]